MEATPCLMSDCAARAESELTVNDNGLLTIYAICATHLEAIQNGGMFPQPANPTRGLIGLRQT